MKVKYFFKLFLVMTLIFCVKNISYSANIVYPKSDNVIIDSPRTFFIGNETPDVQLKINDEPVILNTSGAFWHTVNLNVGENLFKIDNGIETKVYKITRPVPLEHTQTPIVLKEIQYKTPIVISTIDDNVPLRSTPVDSGINRLQHLQKGIKFLAVGEYGDFYKVQLSKDNFAWIAKTSANNLEQSEIKKSIIESYTYDETQQVRVFKIKLSDKVQYTLVENNGLDLTIYNVDGFPSDKYEFHINKVGKMAGYSSFYEDDNELVIMVKNFPKTDFKMPLSGIKITIDPGHGGTEFGAIGCLEDKEKDVNLAIALKLRDKLKEAGADVYMTRSDDQEVSLSDRVKNSNLNDSTLFISIHNNALPDSLADQKSSGSEIYYYYPQSESFAKSILSSVVSETGLKDNGVKQQSFAVVRNTQSLSVLLEVGYLINPDDDTKLSDDNFQNTVATAILHGVENYLK